MKELYIFVNSSRLLSSSDVFMLLNEHSFESKQKNVARMPGNRSE